MYYAYFVIGYVKLVYELKYLMVLYAAVHNKVMRIYEMYLEQGYRSSIGAMIT